MKLLSIGPPGLDSSGYGEMHRRVILALEDMGWKIAMRPFHSLNAIIQDADNESRLRKMETNPLPPPGSPLIFFAPAPMFKANPNYYNVGFTMTEVDHINQEWVSNCNSMDEVWVPSRFNYETFLYRGVRPEKLHIMHLGIDTQHFKPSRRNEAKEKFTFLACFELVRRKACDVLMETFCEEFRPDEPVELVIKAFENGGRYDPQGKTLTNMLHSVLKKYPEAPSITLKKEILPYSELPSLYKDADCFISTSRGEGWNLPVMEAMACGMPVIALNWSGQTEYLTPLNSFLVEVSELEELKEPWCPDCRWAVVNKKKLRRVMRTVFEQPLVAIQKGVRSRLDIRKKFSIKTIADQITQRLKKRSCGYNFSNIGERYSPGVSFAPFRRGSNQRTGR